MSRKAVIYIRTSSESQAEKSSPVEQEADCRRLAQEKGLAVIRIYRDIEKYRVKNKLIEPSGARTDRPAFQTMLGDASRGDFDTILAWREDRLYRGIRPMLAVLEVVHKQQINLLLSKEFFDPKLAPLRAWVAQMELESIRERMDMGVKARLRAGKANTGQDRYGYVRVGEKINVVEAEAVWVRLIFKWYTQRVPLPSVRKRLIAANAPQKGSSIPRRIQWARSSIQSILYSAKEYAYGLKVQSRAGEKYQILVDPILDIQTYETFIKMRAENKTFPSQRIQHDYLLAGHLKCACNLTWRARTNTHRRSRKGEWIERKTPIGTYFCPQPHHELRPASCPKSVGAKQAEAQVWDKLCEFVLDPAFLLEQSKRLSHHFGQNRSLLQQNLEQIQDNLKLLEKERQEFITHALHTRMADDEFGTKIAIHYEKAKPLERREVAIKEEIDTYADLDFDARVSAYVQNIQAGLEEIIKANPETTEERHSLFLRKKRLVDELLEECVIDGNRQIHIKFRTDKLSLMKGNEIT
jgi:DNA invertase Pin-like site-specific DNA recombinase